MVQERNSLNLPTVSYTRGTDLSGTFEGAGGIGGLLSRTDHSSLVVSHSYYHADGNGNIIALIDTNRNVVARYAYEPFGRVFSMSGPLAEANLYRFSSKEVHQASGFIYYLYRYYDANLQRWINRDPIEEAQDPNLYRYIANGPSDGLDAFGLARSSIGRSTGYGGSFSGGGAAAYLNRIISRLSFAGAAIACGYNVYNCLKGTPDCVASEFEAGRAVQKCISACRGAITSCSTAVGAGVGLFGGPAGGWVGGLVGLGGGIIGNYLVPDSAFDSLCPTPKVKPQ